MNLPAIPSRTLWPLKKTTFLFLLAAKTEFSAAGSSAKRLRAATFAFQTTQIFFRVRFLRWFSIPPKTSFFFSLSVSRAQLLAASQNGETAVIELSTFGILQRIASPIASARVVAITFPSPAVLVIFYTLPRGSSLAVVFAPDSAGNQVKWRQEKKVSLGKGRFSCVSFE